MGINSLELTRINKRVEAVNKIADPNERIKECRELFIDVLKDNSLFVVATPETTKDQWDNNRIKPYIAQAGQGELYFMRVFTDEELAKRCAKRIESVLEDGQEMIIKISKEQLVSIVKDYFILGIDGILLNDGENWITFNCEAFLHAAFVDVLNIPSHYDVNFVNTVKAVYDIEKKRVSIVAPIKYYEGITDEDVFNGKADLYNFGEELLLIEYYDKYKIEHIFKEKVYWYQLTTERLCSLIKTAKEKNLKNIKFAYRGKEGNGTPENILGLLTSIGFNK